MFRQPAGTILLLVASMAVSSRTAEAQFFGLGSKHQNPPKHEQQEVMPNASCGLKSCPPRKQTFGYYRENWRRWPVTDSAITDLQLSPFVNTPPDSVPNPIVPEPRDEERDMPRRRRAGGSGSSFAPRPPATVVPSTPDPSPGFAPSNNDVPSTTPGGNLPGSSIPDTTAPNDFSGSDLPSLPSGDDDVGFPDDDFTLPGDSGTGTDSSDSSGGFFPDAEIEPTPDTQPDSLPGIETESEDSPPGDIFDLDDFSQRQPAGRRSRELRRRGVSQRQLSHRGAHPRTLSRQPVQLASRRAPGQRSNPLRVRRAVMQRPAPAQQREHAPQQHRTVSYYEDAAPTQYAPEYESQPAPNRQPVATTPKSVGGTRRNPLR